MTVGSSAVFSDCGEHRLLLRREWAKRGLLYTFVGVNPSTASAEEEDQTTKKWRGFVERWGGRGYLAVNVFSLIATDVRQLADVWEGDLRHELWGTYVDQALEEADVVVFCWGRRGKVPKGVRNKLDEFEGYYSILSLKPVMCFGQTADGSPKHPMMLGYDTELQLYEL